MNLEQRIHYIKEHLLNPGGYTIAAKECLGLIEYTLRELLLRHVDILDADTQRKIRKEEEKLAKGGRGKTIQEFTMGQLLGIVRDSDFVNAWSKATNKDLFNIRMVNLDAVGALRNSLIHNSENANESQALFLFSSLRLIIESFGIESLEEGPQTNLKALPPIVQLPNPYRGLYAFREQDAPYFFGRTAETQDLLQLVTKRPFVAVLGNSGSGKSSLVLAGLMPALRKTAQWLMVQCRPQTQPLHQVAEALIDVLYQTELNEVTRLSEIQALQSALEKHTLTLVSVIQRILTKHPTYSRLLLIIDQFEELYTLSPAAVQSQFIALLLQLCTAPAPVPTVTVLITLRADFLGYALGEEGLAKLLDGYRNKMLGNLGEVGLAAAIEEPARALGVQLEEGLAKRMVQEVGAQAGSLPLLQFALQQLWERRVQNMLTYAEYEALGTVTQALARHADAVYGRFSEAGRTQLRQLLIQMVRPGEGTADTRQVVSLSRLGMSRRELVRQLADARLVATVREERTGEETVELVHEALIRYWQPLQEWMKEDRTFRVWQEGLRRDMQDQVWLREGRLAMAQDWLEKRREECGEEERAFIEASVALREKEAQEREQQRQERERLQRRNLWVVTISFLVALVLWLFGWWQWGEAEQQTQTALRTQSLFLADLARQAVETGHPFTAMRLALEALPGTSKANPQRPFVQEASQSLFDAVNRHYSGIFEHDESVGDAVFQPKGNLLLTYAGNKVYLWDMPSRQLRATLSGHTKGITDAAFSPDGQRVVTASLDNTARLWEVVTGHELAVLKGHEGIVNAAAFSPDGQRVVTASWDNTARLWEGATGRELAVLKGHQELVTAAAFSPDGQRVVTASGDNTARLWEGATGRELAVLTGHQELVTSAAFSPDGQRVVTASKDKTARLWEGATGRELAVLKGHEDWVNSAAFSPDGLRVVTASSDKTARLWEGATGRELAVLTGHESVVNSAAFSPDGQRVVTASDDKTARLWEGATGRELAVLTGHNDWVNSAAFSPDGQRVVTASRDNTARLWEGATGRELAVLTGHNDWVTAAAFSPDGQRVVTASWDKTARLWEGATGRQLAVLTGHESPVTAAAFSPDGQRVVTASEDNTARLWEGATGRQLAVLTGHQKTVTAAAFSPDGQRVVTASEDNTARLWEGATGRELAVLKGHEDRVTSAAFSPDGQRVVTASDDKTARLWEGATGRELAVLKGHQELVTSAAFSPDGQRVVTASWDNTARLWEGATGRELAVLKGHESVVTSAAFSPDGQRVVTASRDNTARLWEGATGRELAVLTGHEGAVFSVAFSPEGQRVVTASLDKTARLWEVATGRELAVLKGHESSVNSAAFSPDGQRVVTASWDNTARLWLVFANLREMVAYAQQMLPRTQLTCKERRRFFLLGEGEECRE